MPIRFALPLTFLVLAPIVLVGWLAMRDLQSQSNRSRAELERLIRSQLSVHEQEIAARLSEIKREVESELPATVTNVRSLNAIRRSSVHAEELLWVTARGQLAFPERVSEFDESGKALLPQLRQLARQMASTETQQVDTDSNSTGPAKNSLKTPQPSEQGKTTSSELTKRSLSNFTFQSNSLSSSNVAASNSVEWSKWFFGPGLQLIASHKLADGGRIGMLLSRGRWMAELVAELPDQSSSGESLAGQIQLLDESGRTVYLWGRTQNLVAKPVVTVPLAEPLGNWQLAYFPEQNSKILAASSWTDALPFVSTLSLLALGLIACGVYVARATSRQLRLAQQKVSFAAQVSHELRTPLTNIRLYAELAARDLESGEKSNRAQNDRPANASKTLQRLQVIQLESDRLGRLIGGILDVMQGSKPRPAVFEDVHVDQLIRQVVNQFRPSLESAEIVVDLDLNVDAVVRIDPDVVEQILVNLISNVEKYAADGRRLQLVSTHANGIIRIGVRDFGSGIPAHQLTRIFQPFERLDHSITAPSGTGLGLTIAKSAAERHGGTLTVQTMQPGTLFEFQFPVVSS
jgi:signal transduction histidine kinase